MKKKIFISFALVVTLLVSAQQKNTLLDASFWKTLPDIAAVKAEIAKGNSPSESNVNAFDVTVFAINNEASLETIKFLLAQPGNEVNKSTHDNRIYLHWAANKGNEALVDYLIAKGSDIHLEDSHGATPITFAASSGQTNTAIYETFFKAGINPKTKYKEGVNLLLMAIPSDKNFTLTNYFISKGLSLKDADTDGNTAFNYAARTGDITLLKTLLAKGVKYNDNALLIAAQGSRRQANTIETYRYLVEELKLKPTITSKTGETVLHYIAGKSKQTEIINYFLSKGVDLNKPDNDGKTAIMVASESSDTAALKLLLPRVKNTNFQNKKGESALTMAMKSGTPEAVVLLLNNGAAINVEDKEGNNLGYYLIQSYKPMGRVTEAAIQEKQNPFDAKIKILQDQGFNLVAPQKDGSTLYHFAVAKNDLALLEKISHLNMDVNAKNKDGITALHKAAMMAQNDAIMKYLISVNAKKELKTEFDETAFDLAKENETLTKNNVSLEFLK